MKLHLFLIALVGMFFTERLQLASKICTATVILMIGEKVWWFIQHRRRFARLPGPPHSFFWGHLKFLRERIAEVGDSPEMFIRIWEEFAPDDCLFLDLWPVLTPIVMIYEQTIADKIQRIDDLPKAQEVYYQLTPVLGRYSMITVEGDQWQKLRKMFNPAFSQGHLDTLVPAMVEEALVYVTLLNEAAEKNKVVMMLDAITMLTLDVIGRVILGTKFNSQRGKGASLVNAFLKVLSVMAVGNEYRDLINTYNPVAKYRRWIAEQNYFKELESFITARIIAAEHTLTKPSTQDVLDLALQDEEYGSQASIEELVDQARTFLFAGHDTTASTITWIYYYLSCNPACLAKMKAEHDEVLGPETDPFKVALKISADPKILARLDYTLAVMKEVLRLRPIGDGVRYPPKGYIIRHPNGAEFDTTGMILSIQHQGLQMKEDVWGPNSRVFDPERFMPGKPVPVAYMPFAQRPRDCIGRNLAYLEAKVAMALTIRSFEFHPTKELHQIYKGTKKPSDGAPMKVTRIE